MAARLAAMNASLSSPCVDPGVADATGIEEIGVTWPGAPAEETFSGAGLDGIWLLAAGSGQGVKVTQAAFVLGGGAPMAH